MSKQGYWSMSIYMEIGPASSMRRAETCHYEALVLGAQSLLARGPLCEYNVGKQSNGCGLGLKDRRQGEK